MRTGEDEEAVEDTPKRRDLNGSNKVPPRQTWPPALALETVLVRARESDPEAISLLYRRFLPVVYRYSLARVGTPHAAEDVTSETFFAVIEHIQQTRASDELSFVAWLLGIARNKVLMHLRGAKVNSRLTDVEDVHAQLLAEAEGGDPLRVVTARESWAEVVDALNRLTEEQRTVLLYRCVLGYSTEEAGELMAKKPGTIRALQFRALASLARYLQPAQSPAEPSRLARYEGGRP